MTWSAGYDDGPLAPHRHRPEADIDVRGQVRLAGACDPKRQPIRNCCAPGCRPCCSRGRAGTRAVAGVAATSTTGSRVQELIHMACSDISSNLKTILVTAKPDIGPWPKRRERTRRPGGETGPRYPQGVPALGAVAFSRKPRGNCGQAAI